MPMLLDERGIPLFAPTVFILTQVRARNRAANTIEQALRSVKVLYLHCHSVGIDIEERIRTGRMLSISEIDGLARAVRLPVPILTTGDGREWSLSRGSRVVSLERARARIRTGGEEMVDPKTAATRLRYIHQYLSWLSLDQLSKLSERSDRRADYEGARNVMLAAITARVAAGGKPADREGLSESATTELLRITRPDCPDNRWSQPAARTRNQLIVLMLYTLGLRMGELLTLKVHDIDFRQNRLTVVRRPDDPEDPRAAQPTVKTLGRHLPLDRALSKLLYEYVLTVRAQFRCAGFHPFLLVETDAGRPLSKSALGKVFNTLAGASELLAGISPHVLRHSWNDRFSALADKRGMTEAEEEKARSYLMGWKETSGTARTYTRRHVREAAKKASLELQRSLIGDGQES